VSTFQKTKNRKTDDSIFFIASAVLIYFINYFFIFIYENRMKTISLDYKTAIISLISTTIIMAAILFFYKLFMFQIGSMSV
jgi:hypothetical protein